MENATLRSERVSLETIDGPMNAYVSQPRDGEARPGIVVFQEAFGVNAHIRDVADRLARLGFVAIAPELYHRTAETGFEAPYGASDKIREHLAAVTPARIVDDARAAYGWLERHADPTRLSAIGFCMGGRAAYLANAHLPLRAAVAFYAGGIVPDLLDAANAQHGPLLMFWGGLDAHISPEQRTAVAQALTAANADHAQVVFSKADHGFFCDARASYNPAAAVQAWALSLAFLTVYGAAPQQAPP